MEKLLTTLVILMFSLISFSQVQVSVMYGDWGEENSWEIVDQLTQNVLIGGVGYASPCQYNDYTYGLPSGEYKFIAYDSYGDGWIGQNCIGSFEITPINGIGTGEIFFNHGRKLEATFTVFSTGTPDIGIAGLINPITSPNLGVETPILKIRNYGSDTLNVVEINYIVNNSTPVNEIYVGNISPGELVEYTFLQPIDMSIPADYNITFSVNVLNDTLQIQNNQLTTTVTNITMIDSFPWVEPFDSFPVPGWYANHISVWVPNIGQSPTNTWLSYANTAAFANMFYWPNGWADFRSPPVLLTEYSKLLFDWSSAYNVLGLDDALEVQISTDLGDTWTTLWYRQGVDLQSEDGATPQLPGYYITEVIDLTQYTGEIVYFNFKAITGHGANIFIDNVSVIHKEPIDIELVDIYIDNDCNFTNTEHINFIIQNDGQEAINNFMVAYSVNGVSYLETVIQTIYASSGSNNTIVYTSNNVFDMSVAGNYTIDANVITIGDNEFNSLVKTFKNIYTINTFPFVEDFETGKTDYFKFTENKHSEVEIYQVDTTSAWYETQANTYYNGNIGHFVLMSAEGQGSDGWGGNTYELAWSSSTRISEIYSCPIDATSLTTLELKIDLKQFLKYQVYYTWFRVLVNDSVIGDLGNNTGYNPTTEYSDDVVQITYNLNEYAGTIFDLKFQAVNKYDNDIYPMGNMTMLDNITLQEVPLITQEIDLKSGWGLMSTYVEAPEPSFDTIFANVITEVILVKADNGTVYWPLYGLNMIGDISIYEGYQIKTYNQTSINIEGYAAIPEENAFIIDAGFSLIPYMRDNPGNIGLIMSSITSDIVLIGDENGLVYWPLYGVNMIGDMLDGEGYKMVAQNSITFTYPSNTDPTIIGTSGNKTMVKELQHYDKVEPTSSNMFLAIESDQICYGDEIGVYTGDKLIGSTVVQKDGVGIVTIWGNDVDINDNKVANEGDIYTIELFRYNESVVNKLSNLVFKTGSEHYKTNSIAVVVDFDPFTKLYQNYPNPVTGNTNIDFLLNVSGDISIELYDNSGKHILTIVNRYYNSGLNTVEFDISDIKSGIYYYIMRTEIGKSHVKKMTILN